MRFSPLIFIERSQSSYALPTTPVFLTRDERVKKGGVRTESAGYPVTFSPMDNARGGPISVIFSYMVSLYHGELVLMPGSGNFGHTSFTGEFPTSLPPWLS